MFDEKLKDAWKRAGAGAAPLTRTALEDLLRPSARRAGRALESFLGAYLGLLALTVSLALVNLYGYRENPVMLAVESAIAGLSLAFGAYGARLLAGLRRSARADRPLVETLELRLALHERWFGPWLWMAAATPWLLSLAINTLVDNDQGRYRVNHPVEFGAVTAVMLGGTYLLLRVSTLPMARELQAVRDDLRTETLDATPLIEKLRRRTRIWMAIGVVLLSLSVLLGVLLWLGAF